jgi:hypothetical protein
MLKGQRDLSQRLTHNKHILLHPSRGFHNPEKKEYGNQQSGRQKQALSSQCLSPNLSLA